MRRPQVWLQLLIGWLPMWALFAALIVAIHGSSALVAAVASGRMILVAAALGLVVQRAVERLPWSHPVRTAFILWHVAGALTYSAAWLFLSSVVGSLVAGTPVGAVAPGIPAFMVTGVWLYVMVAGISYMARATERAARAEAMAVRSQIAALRAQLNPHFLFNALHTVVQLIPREPTRAAQAAERLGSLLRDTIEEDRDLVPLAEERGFVERYLDVERLRFGDRLQITVAVTEDADDVAVPSFSLMTLVENAVRHGAEPNENPTEIEVIGSATEERLLLTVRDSGVGMRVRPEGATEGTGLRRLRDRLTALYGVRATLSAGPQPGRGFLATLTIPRDNR